MCLRASDRRGEEWRDPHEGSKQEEIYHLSHTNLVGPGKGSEQPE